MAISNTLVWLTNFVTFNTTNNLTGTNFTVVPTNGPGAYLLGGYQITVSTNYDALGAALTQGAANTNFTFQVGANVTNAIAIQGAASTNESLLIGANGTNYTQQIGANGTNYTQSVGANVTNAIAIQGAANTNESLLIGGNGTNYTQQVGANATNFIFQVGQGNTNLSQTLAANGTNYTQSVGANVTNAIAIQGAANTNESLLIGANGTNAINALGNSTVANLTNSLDLLSGTLLGSAVHLADTNGIFVTGTIFSDTFYTNNGSGVYGVLGSPNRHFSFVAPYWHYTPGANPDSTNFTGSIIGVYTNSSTTASFAIVLGYSNLNLGTVGGSFDPLGSAATQGAASTNATARFGRSERDQRHREPGRGQHQRVAAHRRQRDKLHATGWCQRDKLHAADRRQQHEPVVRPRRRTRPTSHCSVGAHNVTNAIASQGAASTQLQRVAAHRRERDKLHDQRVAAGWREQHEPVVRPRSQPSTNEALRIGTN